MLLKYVQEKHLVPIDDPGLPVPKSARFTYLTLGEIALAWLRIIDQGIVCTHVKTPSEEDFARIAIDTYRSLSDSDGTEWVLTGKWLEQIALEHGLHPVVTKNLLAKAKDADLIRLFAEGSTPDTRFDEHFFWMLARKADVLRIDKTYLYHGDFILPGTSAVRVKIQGVDYAT
jgi:hypothetical protein